MAIQRITFSKDPICDALHVFSSRRRRCRGAPPRGAALVLLNVVRQNPRAVVAALNTAYRDRYAREMARQRLDAELDPFE